ncbi:hypothetical protein JXL21_11125 [Candidatus Bathyarchaeota archaeon]|nr:hypothetical protein [Candidatus Bathyarchaeota archaeon]
MTEPSKLKRFIASLRNIPSNIKEGVLAYEKSYHKGVEKYGVWWKVFHWSMWLFILTFIGTAVIALVYFLPQLQMIRYI